VLLHLYHVNLIALMMMMMMPVSVHLLAKFIQRVMREKKVVTDGVDSFRECSVV